MTKFVFVTKISPSTGLSIALIVFLSSVCFTKSSEENLNPFRISNTTTSFQRYQLPLIISFNNTLGQGVEGRGKRKRSSKVWASRPRAQRSRTGNWIQNLFSSESANRHLQLLKDKLLAYYAKKSEDIGSARDGIAFPSLEGALLSLAFLTFAVFLIDLVQTLLSRLRGPVYLNNGLGRKKRSVEASLDDNMSTLTSLVISSIERPFFYFKNYA